MNTRPEGLRRSLTGFLILALALCLGIAVLAQPSRAAAADGPTGAARTAAYASAPKPNSAPKPLSSTAEVSDRSDARRTPIDKAHLPPKRPTTSPVPQKTRNGATKGAAASCTPGDFGSRTGSALVAFIQASTTGCVNTLFSLTGTDAHNAFREPQMVTVANALDSSARSYPGDNSANVWQLVLFLRAGYYVQSYNADAVGPYGTALAGAIEAALDTFTASPHFMDVSAANGDIMGEVLILTDSANEQARYLATYKKVLNAYNSSYDAYWSMDTAVNDVFTPLFRGHWNPAYIAAVTADPSIIDTLSAFAQNHLAKLNDAWFYLDANAGSEMARFLDTPALQAKVRPLVKSLLGVSAITGPTAPLWVAVAAMTDAYDQAQCSYYGTCDFVGQLTAAALPITYNCDADHTFRAQSLSDAALAAACTSVKGQDAYFHGIVKDSGPVANDHNTNIQIVTFASPKDYQTYSGWIFGNSTDNGGEYLEGDPSDPANQARFLSYVKSVGDGFPGDIWNLNHEYTHYLDGRYDMAGDFNAGQDVPDIWWIEGFAEYVSYSYRGMADTEAIADAAQHTYALSTLWQSSYANSDLTRTYPWGYLATRYMVEKHPADVQNMLAKFRSGDYQGAYAVYGTGIGTRYDADFNTWLDACAAGACGGSTGSGPTAAFDAAVSGLTVGLTDRSTDTGGTITARSWNFGDGTTSTAANPSKTYQAAGTYTIALTVTDSKGLTATTSRSVAVTGAPPNCTDPDTRVLGRNCSRSALSAAAGGLDYFYLYLPAGKVTLKITSTGGTGNADLYYNPSTWATTTAYTARSAKSGNAESITVTNSAAGYRYISLYGQSAFSGVTLTTAY
ncbi:protease [Streptomyces xanthochromogenes]|uniref:collagenase n=1 Tax=Streptomyces xanthochromogenes TaxID=67384 RepID=UPI00199AAAE0|nr:collagenase [Streptomyces xanthochromogenes]GHB45947.1 protease [Streptomyces xanthochromogenes]